MIVFVVFGFILGSVLGSFVKAVADRSLTKDSFIGRSYCPQCRKTLRWYDLFPVASYLILKGRCRDCQKKIPLEYFLIELLMGVVTGYLFFQFIPPNFLDLNWQRQILTVGDLLFKVFIAGVLIAALLTDVKKGLIPDRITLPAALIAFIYLLLSSVFKGVVLYQSLVVHPLGKYLLPPQSDYYYRTLFLDITPLWAGLISMVIVVLFFGAIILLTRGRGMGGGDLKLGLLIGLGFGFPNSLMVLLLSFVYGSVVAVGLLLFGKKKFGHTVPFGPFLTLGGLTVLFWGDQIMRWYLSLSLPTNFF